MTFSTRKQRSHTHDVCLLSTLKQPNTNALQCTHQNTHILHACHNIEHDIQQAMIILDRDSGKILIKLPATTMTPEVLKGMEHLLCQQVWLLSPRVGGHIKNPNHTVHFIPDSQVPQKHKQDVTYGCFVYLMHPKKSQIKSQGQEQLTWQCSYSDGGMLVTKILVNSIVSIPNAHLMRIDLSNFYYMTPLK